MKIKVTHTNGTFEAFDGVHSFQGSNGGICFIAGGQIKHFFLDQIQEYAITTSDTIIPSLTA